MYLFKVTLLQTRFVAGRASGFILSRKLRFDNAHKFAILETCMYAEN
jgi:hypothetical protein